MKHMLAAFVVVYAGVLSAEMAPAAAPAIAEAAAATEGNRADCIKETGSRIKRSAQQPCISAPGQVITRDDISRTGEINTADALRKLAPAVR